jgi:hypothetical protein
MIEEESRLYASDIEDSEPPPPPPEQVLGELIRTGQNLRIHLVSMDASSYHLDFRPVLDDCPLEKLLCLAVAVGLLT